MSETAQAMTAIQESSRRISNIVDVIDDLAFQTNLLALNAAVEAARAGEQGLGFAVVDAEVRKLAQRSAEAAREIRTLVTDNTVKVEEGNKLVERSGRSLQEVVAAVKNVSTIVSEITSAVKEQAMGIERVNQIILRMDQITQQNAALVERTEKTASASQTMGEQAIELESLVAFFQLERSLNKESHAF